MAAYGILTAGNTTAFDHTSGSTWEKVTGAEYAAGTLAATTKYLMVFSGHISTATASSIINLKVVEDSGGTPNILPDGCTNDPTFRWEIRGSDREHKWMVVFEYTTGAATTKSVELQIRGSEGTNATMLHSEMWAIPVEGLGVSDYKYVEDKTNAGITTTETQKLTTGSITTDTGIWVALGCAIFTGTTTGVDSQNCHIRFKRSGDVTETMRDLSHEMENETPTFDDQGWIGCIYPMDDLTATGNTFTLTLQAESTSNIFEHEFASIALLNLESLFEHVESAVAAGPTDLGVAADTVTEIAQIAAFTVSADSDGVDHYFMGQAERVSASTVTNVNTWFDVDDAAIVPLNGNRDFGWGNHDAQDKIGDHVMGVKSLTNASSPFLIEYMAEDNRVAGTDEQNIRMVVFSGEAAAGGSPHTSTGAMTVGGNTLVGTGSHDHEGTAALTVAAASMTGTGSHDHEGTAALTLGVTSMVGTGSHAHESTGALTLGAMVLSAAAQHGVSATYKLVRDLTRDLTRNLTRALRRTLES